LLMFPATILNHMLLIIIWYFFHNRFWPRPRSFGLGLEVLASFNITGIL